MSPSPPAVRGHFAFGNTLQYVQDPLGFLVDTARRYGDISQLNLGGETCILLANPSDIEAVLCTRHQEFCKDKLIWRSPMRLAWRMIPPFQKRLLFSAADDARRQPGFWRKERKLVQPAFQPHRVEQYAAVMRDETERFINCWEPGQSVDLIPEFTALTLIILARCLFGAHLHREAKAINQALSIMVSGLLRSQTSSQLARSLPLPSNLALRRASNLLDMKIREIVRQARDGNSEGQLLNRLIDARDDAGEPLPDEAIRNEVLTMLLAAHETAALSTAYALYLLCGNKTCLQRATEEAASDDFTYLGMVMRESNRLYPSAWLIGREAREDCKIGGYAIDAHSQLLISQWVVHRDPRWYEDPDNFRPERWADGLIRRNPRCSYLAFGHGPTACVGEMFSTEESFQLIAGVLRNLRLRPVSTEPLRLRAAETLKPRDGLWVCVEKRIASHRQSSYGALIAAKRIDGQSGADNVQNN